MINSDNNPKLPKKSRKSQSRQSGNIEICRICEFHIKSKTVESKGNIVKPFNKEPYISWTVYNSIRDHFKSENMQEMLLPCNCLIPVHLDCLLKQILFTNTLKCSNCNFYYCIKQIKSSFIKKLFAMKYLYRNLLVLLPTCLITFLLIWVIYLEYPLRFYLWKILLIIVFTVIEMILLVLIILLLVDIYQSPLNDTLCIREYDKQTYNERLAEKSYALYSLFMNVNYDIAIGEILDFLMKKSYLYKEKERRFEQEVFKELEKTILSPCNNNNNYTGSIDQRQEGDSHYRIEIEGCDNENNKSISYSDSNGEGNTKTPNANAVVTLGDSLNKNNYKINVCFDLGNQGSNSNSNNADADDKNNLLLINKYPLKMTKIEEVDSKLAGSNDEERLSIRKKGTGRRMSWKNYTTKVPNNKEGNDANLRSTYSNKIDQAKMLSEVELIGSEKAMTQFNNNHSDGEQGPNVHNLQANLKGLSPILKMSSSSFDSLKPKLNELFGKKKHHYYNLLSSEGSQSNPNNNNNNSSQIVTNINKFNIQNLVINTGTAGDIGNLDKLLQENILIKKKMTK